jgi:hypothetical protein
LSDPQSMFTFTDEELSLAPKMRSVLIPPHMRSEQDEAADRTITEGAEMSAPQPNDGSNVSQTGGGKKETNHSSDSAGLPSTAEEDEA